MKKYFIPNKFGMLLMFGLLLLLCVVALAQTAIPGQDQALFGLPYGDVALGILASVLTSVWAKVHWPDKAKQWSAFGIAVVLTIAAGIYMKLVTPASVTPETFKQTFDAIFASAGVTYLILSKPLRSLQENVNAGKAAAPTLPK